MADERSDTTREYTGSSGDEYVPNSQSSETEDEEYATAQKATRKDMRHNSFAEMSVAESDSESDSATKHAGASSRKRTNKHMHQCSPQKKRGKMNRNTTHSSKINCCDVAVVKEWLRSCTECSCECKCLEKLSSLGDDAITMVAELRHRRFAGPSPCEEKKHQCWIHPGVKIYS